jgi:hypothetical protein
LINFNQIIFSNPLFVFKNENESAIKLLNNLITNYYNDSSSNIIDSLYKQILSFNIEILVKNYNLKSMITQELLDKQLLGINLCYWFEFKILFFCFK